jgi:hypothetical protein
MQVVLAILSNETGAPGSCLEVVETVEVDLYSLELDRCTPENIERGEGGLLSMIT